MDKLQRIKEILATMFVVVLTTFIAFTVLPSKADAATVTLSEGTHTTAFFNCAGTNAQAAVTYTLAKTTTGYTLKLTSVTFKRTEALGAEWKNRFSAGLNMKGTPASPSAATWTTSWKKFSKGWKGSTTINFNNSTVTITSDGGSPTVTIPFFYYSVRTDGTKSNSGTHSLQFNRASYTVSYAVNGGTASTTPGKQTKYHAVNLALSSTTPERTGYTFVNWNTAANGSGTNYAKGASYTGNADLALYAQWTANNYTISYDANGGTGSMSPTSASYNQNAVIQDCAFTNGDYEFAGWGLNPNGPVTYMEGDTVKNLTATNNGNVTLYAQWVEMGAVMSVVTGEASFTNVRAYRSGARVAKVDSVSGSVLEGAKFIIEPGEDYGDRPAGTIYDEEGQAIPSITITTGPDGTAQTRSDALSANSNFRIREIEAPLGYQIDDTSWKDFSSSENDSEIVDTFTWKDSPLTAEAVITALKSYSMKTGADAEEPIKIRQEQFTFQLHKDSSDGDILSIVSVPASNIGKAVATFPALSYTRDDIGTHEYWITENPPEDVADIVESPPQKVVVTVEEHVDNSNGNAAYSLLATVAADDPADPDATVKIKNVHNSGFDMELYKKDAQTAEPLKDSVFAVFEIGPLGDGTPSLPTALSSLNAFNESFSMNDKKNALDYDADALAESCGMKLVQLIETDATGYGKTAGDALSSGHAYAIVEVGAPTGYLLEDHPIVYVIDDYAPNGMYSHINFPADSIPETFSTPAAEENDNDIPGVSIQVNLDSNGNRIGASNEFSSNLAWSGYKFVIGEDSPVQNDQPFVFSNEPNDDELGGLGARKTNVETGAGVPGAVFAVYNNTIFMEKYNAFKESHPGAIDSDFFKLFTTQIVEDTEGNKFVSSDYIEPEDIVLEATDADGYTKSATRALPPGEYRIVEITPPFEYEPPEYNFSAEGGNNGSVTVTVEKDKITLASMPLSNRYNPVEYNTSILATKDLLSSPLHAGAFDFALYSADDETLSHPLIVESNGDDGIVNLANCYFTSANKSYRLESPDGDIITVVPGITESTSFYYRMKEVIPDDAKAMWDGEEYVYSEYIVDHDQQEIDALVWVKDDIAYDTSVYDVTVKLDLDTEDEKDVLTVSYEQGNAFVNKLDIDFDGSVTAKKVDRETGDPLIGTTFAIEGISANGKEIYVEMDTDEDGIAVADLPFGTDYKIKELVPPDGHAIDPNWGHVFSLTSEEPNADFTIGDDICADDEEEKIQFPLAKYWTGAIPADSVEVAVVGITENSEIVEHVTLEAVNNWKGMSPKMPVYDEFGDAYSYHLEESSGLLGYASHTLEASGDELAVNNEQLTELSIKKTVSGETPQARQLHPKFTFIITLTDAGGTELKDTFPTIEPNGLPGQIVSGAVVQLAPDEQLQIKNLPYNAKYSVSEEVPSGYSPKISVNGTPVTGTVASGTLDQNANLIFENAYSSEKEITPQAIKTLENRAAVNGEFKFELSLDGTVLQTAPNSDGGMVNFAPLRYTQADDGRTFTYRINEKFGTDSSIAYDKHVYDYVVEVHDNGEGVLNVTGTYKDGESGETVAKPAFNNQASRLATKATDASDDDKFVSQDSGQPVQEINDLVTYSGLRVGTEYILRAKLVDAAGADIPGSTNEIRFTPSTANGSVKISIPLDVAAYSGEKATAFEYLYIAATNELAGSHEDPNDVDQTVNVVHVSTTATDANDNDKFISQDTGQNAQSVKDTVAYSGLVAGEVYNLKAWLVDRSGNMIEGTTATKEFTATASSGTAEIEIPVDLTNVSASELVAFEELYKGSTLIAQHKDPTDVSQTVFVVRISTVASNKAGGSKYLADNDGSNASVILDTVTYSGLPTGKQYRMEASLHYSDGAGEAGSFKGTQEFSPTSASGSVDVEIPVVLSQLSYKKITVFEKLVDIETGKVIAVHEELGDNDQTVRNIRILTTATDKSEINAMNGDKYVTGSSATISDVVAYEGLEPGHSYKLVGTVMDKVSNAPVKVNNEPVSASTTFAAQGESGTATLDIQFDLKSAGSQVNYGSLVVFEKLYDADNPDTVIAVHESLEDEAQTVNHVDISTVATNADDNSKYFTDNGTAKSKLKDTVSCYGLVSGHAYRLEAVLMDAATGKPAVGTETISKTFTAESAGAEGFKVVVDGEYNLTSFVPGKYVFFEKLYDNDTGKLIAEHEDLGDAAQTLNFVKIKTSAADSADGDRYLGKLPGEIVDTVSYQGVIPGCEYILSATLMKATGENETAPMNIHGSATFTPQAANGSQEVRINVSDTELQSGKYIVYEQLVEKSAPDTVIARHEEPQDKDQTINVVTLRTTATDASDKNHYLTESQENGQITDIVEYDGLIPGHAYILSGTLVNKATGDPVASMTNIRKTFNASDSGVGTETLDMPLPEGGLPLGGYVVFETLYDTGNESVPIVEHASLEDTSQYVNVVKIATEALDDSDGNHMVVGDKISVTDYVKCEGLIPGHKYRLEGKLMSKATNEQVLPAKADEFAVFEFTMPSSEEKDSGLIVESDGKGNCTVAAKFEFESASISYGEYVFFEYLYDDEDTNKLDVSASNDDATNLIASHEDLSDRKQTVIHTSSRLCTVATDAEDGDKYIGTSATVNDEVEYEGLVAGMSYRMTGTLMNKETGEEVVNSDGSSSRGTLEFEVQEGKESGSVVIPIRIAVDAPITSSLVVFEMLEQKDEFTGEYVEIASHRDLQDHDQSVFQPNIGTTATDASDGDRILSPGPVSEILDKVEYSGLDNVTYILRTSLYDKTTGEMVRLADGKEYADTTFESSGTGILEVPVRFDSSDLPEHELVVFEEVLTQDMVSVARHHNPDDENQTVFIAAADEIASILDNIQATGDMTITLVILAGFMASSLIIVLAMRREKAVK